MQDNQSVLIDLAIRQNEPLGLQKQLASSNWLSHRTEWTNWRQDQDNQNDPEKGCICAGPEKNSSKDVVGE
jgi:hypothetical protein